MGRVDENKKLVFVSCHMGYTAYGSVEERNFRKRKQHGEKHSSVNMQTCLRKND